MRTSSIRVLRTLATLLEPTRRRLYQFVARDFRAVSRDEAADAVGVSRAMAAFHLDKLVDAGLVRATYRRLSGRTGRGAGRPAKVYRRVRRRYDLAVPERKHELLARLLAASIGATEDGAASYRQVYVANAFGRSLGVRSRRRISDPVSPEQQARCVADVMTELGFEPTSMGASEIGARNCPFDPLSRQMPSVVCQTTVALLRGVVEGIGAADLQVDRNERPPWCCVVVSALPASSAAASKTATGMR